MSHCEEVSQSQLGMMVHRCRQALESEQGKHTKRPDTLANEPTAQQLQAAWPTKGLNEPGAQRLHCGVPMMECEPAGHTVNTSVVLTTTVPCPPAKMTSPCTGSDVAASPLRATLRAAVLQDAAVALKMSTVSKALAPAQNKRNQSANGESRKAMPA
jgi:hypothetical protein